MAKDIGKVQKVASRAAHAIEAPRQAASSHHAREAIKSSPTRPPAEAAPKDEFVGKLQPDDPPPPPAEPQEHDLGVPMVEQERGQCGSASLAMVMDYWHEQDPANPDLSKDEIARATNPFDAITFPQGNLEVGIGDHSFSVDSDGDNITFGLDGKNTDPINLDGQFNVGLAQFAEQHGYEATVVNHATTDMLRQQIDKGTPVVIPIDILDQGSINHDVVVTGYETDAAGNITAWHINNPWGRTEEWSPQTLDSRWQGHPGDNGTDRQMLVVVPEGRNDLLPAANFTNMSPEMMGTGAYDIIAGVQNQDAGAIAQGGVELAGGLYGGAIQGVGYLADKGGDAMQDAGHSLQENPNLFVKGTGMLLDGSGHLVESGGELLNRISGEYLEITAQAGQVVHKGVDAIDQGFDQAVEFFTEDIPNAANQVIDTAGNLIDAGLDIAKDGIDALKSTSDRIFRLFASIG